MEFEQVALGLLHLPAILLKSLTSRTNEMLARAPLQVSITDLQLRRGIATISGLRSNGTR